MSASEVRILNQVNSNSAELERLPVLLIVEDEVEVQEICAVMFSRLGWSVLTANNAEEALEYLANNEVKAVFSDIRMPGEMDGLALVSHVKANFPSINVALTSGYSNPFAEETEEPVPFLMKPYMMSQLSELSDKLLG